MSAGTALVLGAGGLVGQAFHLGVLTALHEVTGFDGRDADVLVGTSAGSLVAAGLASGLSAGDLTARVLGRPMSAEGRRRQPVREGEVLLMPDSSAPTPGRGPLAPGALLEVARRPWGVRPGAVAASLLPPGRQSTDHIATGYRRLHGGGWPDRDLRICAVRARDARRVVFGSPVAPAVDVGTAVAASCAIPAYFAPVRVGGEAYVDGGAHSPTNADVVAADRPALVLVLSPMSIHRASRRADLPLRLAVRGYLAAEVRRLRRGGSRVVVVQPDAGDLDVMGNNPMQRGRAADVVQRAEQSMRRRLQVQPDLLAYR